MKGWLIFKHSLLMVLRNWREALQVGLVPIALVFTLGTLLFGTMGLDVLLTPDLVMDSQTDALLTDDEPLYPAGFFGSFFLIWIVAFVAMFWVVVSWHRFVLLEEYPKGWIPKFHGDRILAYFGRTLLLGLIAAIAMIPVMAALAMLTGGLATTGSDAVGIIASLLLVLVLSLLLFRLVPILPAAAIGKPLALAESWRATQGATTDILMLALVGFAVQIALQAVVGVFVFVSPVLGLIVSGVTSLVLALVNVSILTTFYGHYVEGRPIG